MAVVPTHAAYSATTKSPWYRRGLILLSVASMVAVVCWVSGVFESSIFSDLVDRAQQEPAAVSAAKAEEPVSIIPPQPVGNDSSISLTPLPLILTGTMPGRNANEGQAFIGVNKDSSQTYAAGAILANNARIAEIHTDHVVLERNGQRVNLYLHGTGKQSDAKRLTSLLTVGGATAPPLAKVTSHEILTDYIRPSPVYDGHVLRGYQLHAGQRSGVFAQMGLQADDLITAINGVTLNEPRSAIEQLKQLTQGYAVTAVVDRKGRIETLSLDGGLIVQDQQRLQSPPDSTSVTLPPM